VSLPPSSTLTLEVEYPTRLIVREDVTAQLLVSTYHSTGYALGYSCAQYFVTQYIALKIQTLGVRGVITQFGSEGKTITRLKSLSDSGTCLQSSKPQSRY
jgi:hypothetical protein